MYITKYFRCCYVFIMAKTKKCAGQKTTTETEAIH